MQIIGLAFLIMIGSGEKKVRGQFLANELF